MGLAVQVFNDESSVKAVEGEWDEMAVAAGRAYCAPAWMLAWWRRARPEGAALRVLAAMDGDRLVGIAPLWALSGEARRSRYEVLAARLSAPAGPLALPGREREVAEALAAALRELSPRPVSIELEDLIEPTPWAELLARAWPGAGAALVRGAVTPVPVVAFGEDYETWFAAKSSKLRQESRRMRRRLEDAGGEFSLVGGDGLDRALQAFERFHRVRWEAGGSDALVAGMHEMFGDAAAALVPEGRLRIFVVEAGGEVIAVNIVSAAGGVASGWNSGFDQAWGKHSPSLVLTLHALADAAGRGEGRMSLGPGAKAYKRRLADGEEPVRTIVVVPRGIAHPVVRLRLAPGQARRWAATHAPEGLRRRLGGSKGG
jgi:CelD/BcsL family acetyltransferase involved in cellulose biosynthesis